ncbi:Putative NADH:flavin oxidoreductase/NADH oxidase, aldolase-type TIM barrel [Colletotrichum destructivum]|uniref:NADH:flavin oxidoreductase/NADH oxidase, aldolase-type TIM barrel n=1 Tax=Colletotrichum destructivum TaxID=34406 RepID=A0AAX4IT82_9PEZI|nr:Putative NADH:flavin oxidoreductase/NADH oxidase, aldolase-type TIM barrel [Colletotrichum destructivum]
MTRVRLVDYSESDGESACEDDPGDADAPVALRPHPPEPQSENELAQIVIELQHQYTEEVEEVQRRQQDSERQLRVWKTQVEDRLQMQVNVMAAIIKVMFGVDAADPAIREYTQRGHGGAKPQVPPTSSPTVTGKRVPRQLRGPHDRARNPRKSTGRANHEEEIGAEQVIAVEVTEEPCEVDEDPTSAARKNGGLQQPLHTQAVPANPYDDPKYFSTLAVLSNDGTEQPVFRFHKHPETVEEQWAEFRYGLHGQPPVERLEELYRAKWRNSTYGRSWFTRRKAFWDKVKDMMTEGRTEHEALGVMSRLAEGGGIPSLIAQLCRERGHGSRPDRRIGRSRLPSKRRRRGDSCDEEGAINSGSGSDIEAVPGRSSPPRLRKRARALILARNWFFLDRFLSDNVNQRLDEYCGSLEYRSRFVLEVVGYQRIGVGLSPFSKSVQPSP